MDTILLALSQSPQLNILRRLQAQAFGPGSGLLEIKPEA